MILFLLRDLEKAQLLKAREGLAAEDDVVDAEIVDDDANEAK